MGGRREEIARRALCALVAAFVLLLASALRADGRIQFLADRLKYPPSAGHADDFRVRTNAALALGSTNDDGALDPLCSGLSDPSEVVRQGAAVALRRLARPSATDCLRARASVEPSSAVKAEIQRAIDALDAASSPAPAPGAGRGGAKYYVALSRITNRSTRPSADVEQVITDAITSQLGKSGDFQLAPSGESPTAAKAALSTLHLKGYYLAISVEKFDYTGEGLRVRVKITVFSYPGKDLRGEVPAGATLPGATRGDKDAEDQLMGIVAARAAELFAQNFK
jgi:HEAT repeats